MKTIDPKILEILKAQDMVTIGMSTGKDSMCCALLLKEHGIKFTPFFFYHCPELKFVERNLAHCEEALQQEIIRLPHPMLYDYLRHQDFQPPDMVFELDAMGFIKTSFSELISLYLEKKEFTYYDIVGARMAESLNRRLVLRKNGGINHEEKKLFPIYDWKTSDVKEYLQAKKFPLTADYRIWSRSFDGLKYQFLFGVREHYPSDWQTLCDYFPLLPLELFRYEQNIKYFK